MMDDVLIQIREISAKYKVEKTILFGSRARGDHSTVSDYDIAIFDNGRLSSLDKAMVYSDIDDINTLKKIDVVFIDKNLDDLLLENIMKEGVVIYEETRK